MLNKKGFTLVEIVAVIVILGLLALIATPAVNKIIRDSQQILYDAQIETIKDGAKNWLVDNIKDFGDNASVSVTLTELKQKGYVDDELVLDMGNICQNQEEIYVLIESVNSGYTYTVRDNLEVCTSSN